MHYSPCDPAIWRILDANFDRAREGLRVMEEHARFIIEDAALSRACKEARHALTEAFGSVAEMLPLARDIVGDVGVDVKTEAEADRSGATAVAAAAAKRTQEALRTLEEYLKVVMPETAARIERIRYAAYDIERRWRRRVATKPRLRDIRVYVILTESLCRGSWYETAEEILSAGAGMLQLREKALPDRDLLDRAKRLAELCTRHAALFVLNDRVDLARLSGADGLHVGQSDLPVAQARRILGPEPLVGVSTHNTAQFEASLGEGPDYVAVGPMFMSPTKPAGELAGTPVLRQARRLSSIPRVAIGGIRPDNAAEVLEADPDAILGVCSAVIADESPGRVVEKLLRIADQKAARV